MRYSSCFLRARGGAESPALADKDRDAKQGWRFILIENAAYSRLYKQSIMKPLDSPGNFTIFTVPLADYMNTDE